MSIDKLHEKIRKLKNPTIIEFGVTPEHLPQHLLDEEGSVHLAYRRFCSELMEKIRDALDAGTFEQFRKENSEKLARRI